MSKDEQISELLLRWEEAWEHGEELLPEDLCADFPDLVETLRERIAALKQMSWMVNSSDGPISSKPIIDSIPELLVNRYRIEELIGEGGYGRVYRAFDQELQRHVAVKVTHTVGEDVRGDSLLQEARRVAQLRHPGIVSVHDVGQDGEIHFIVSDLIEGPNLAELIEKDRPTAIEAALLVAEIAAGLQYAHDQGFVHRDIKPGNILLDQTRKPLITDFGIAATKEELSQGNGTSSGTLAYIAPEQLAGELQLIDVRTDIHALGIVLYELLTGQLPFQARTPMAMREQILFRLPQPLCSVNTSVPAEVEAVCLRCLAKHPADRYSSADELGQALRESVAAHQSTQHKKVMWITLLSLATIGSVIVGAMYVLSFRKPPSTPVMSDRTSETPGIQTLAPEAIPRVLLANRNEVWVMDNSATDISYSFDRTEWKSVNELITTITFSRGQIDDRRLSDGKHKTVFIKYTDRRGNESQVFPLATSSISELTAPENLGQPFDPSRLLNGAPSIKDAAYFDGQTSIDTGVKRFAPVTLEA